MNSDKPIAVFLWCGIITVLILMLFGCSNHMTYYTESVPKLPYAVLFKRGNSYQVVSFPADSIIIETRKGRFAFDKEGNFTQTVRDTISF